jgi:hypothetical protein
MDNVPAALTVLTSRIAPRLLAPPSANVLRASLQPEPDVKVPVPGEIVVPLRVRTEHGELAFFSTVATFGTPLDITFSELCSGSFYPSDESTANAMRTAGGQGYLMTTAGSPTWGRHDFVARSLGSSGAVPPRSYIDQDLPG